MNAKTPFSAEELEKNLAGALKKVHPRPQFSATLRQRIQARPIIDIEKPQLRIKALLLTLGGAVSFSLLTVIFLRALFFFLRRSRQM